MNGPSNILVDTNLIILGIAGNQHVRDVLEGHSLFISVITEIELLSIPHQKIQDERLMQDFISHCHIIDLDVDIKKQTIRLRKAHRTKVPDAIIAASAIVKKLPIYTADKGFSKIHALDIVLL